MSDHGAIDEQVRELVRSHRPELARLVAERLVARNGVEASKPVGHVVTTKLCAVCGERPAAKHRRVCERCWHRHRERQTPAAEPDPPRPGGDRAD